MVAYTCVLSSGEAAQKDQPGLLHSEVRLNLNCIVRHCLITTKGVVVRM